MPWIESHSVIGRHRKFKGLARQLKIPLPQAIGHMHLLWHTAIEQAEDGDLTSWTIGAIADAACWEGSEEEFLKAVQENSLMDEQRIHDWLDHAGKYLISKYKTSNHERLVEIWAKFGKIYGKEVKRNSLVVPLGAPHNITEPNQPQKHMDFLSDFDLARKAYPGTKNGKDTEWENFLKKNKAKAPSIVPLLLPAIEREKSYKAFLKSKGDFCPSWANFQTWINQERWTQEFTVPQKQETRRVPSF